MSLAAQNLQNVSNSAELQLTVLKNLQKRSRTSWDFLSLTKFSANYYLKSSLKILMSGGTWIHHLV
jgi:hypothetical protein